MIELTIPNHSRIITGQAATDGPSNVVAPETRRHLLKVALSLDQHREINGTNSVGDFVFYGSQVTGNAKHGSDIDVLYLHRGRGEARREDERVGDTPVSLYVVPLSEFKADGSERRYGGYFSMKMLSPHFKVGSEIPTAEIHRTVGEFIGPFASKVAAEAEETRFEPIELASHALIAYGRLCHPFRYYTLRSAGKPDFPRVLSHVSTFVAESFLEAEIVTKDSGKYTYTPSEVDYEEEAWKVTAAFSSFGAYMHGNYWQWANTYLQGARDKSGIADASELSLRKRRTNVAS